MASPFRPQLAAARRRTARRRSVQPPGWETEHHVIAIAIMAVIGERRRGQLAAKPRTVSAFCSPRTASAGSATWCGHCRSSWLRVIPPLRVMVLPTLRRDRPPPHRDQLANVRTEFHGRGLDGLVVRAGCDLSDPSALAATRSTSRPAISFVDCRAADRTIGSLLPPFLFGSWGKTMSRRGTRRESGQVGRDGASA